MSKGEELGQLVEQMIIDTKMENPDWTAKEIAEYIRSQLREPERHAKGWPGVSAVKNVLAKWKKRSFNDNPLKLRELDRPWSTISLSNSHFSIHPEALPYVLRVWAKSLTTEVKTINIGRELERLRLNITDPNYSLMIKDPQKRDILTIREAIWVGSSVFCI